MANTLRQQGAELLLVHQDEWFMERNDLDQFLGCLELGRGDDDGLFGFGDRHLDELKALGFVEMLDDVAHEDQAISRKSGNQRDAHCVGISMG